MTGMSCPIRNGLILAYAARRARHGCDRRCADSQPADWQPLALVIVLFGLAVASDVMIVEMRGLRVSGAFFAVVLAMVLLGPAPAAAIGLTTTLVYGAVVARRRLGRSSTTLPSGRRFAVVGGLMCDALMRRADARHVRFFAAVVVVFMATNVLNFLARRSAPQRARAARPSRGRPVALPHDAAVGVRDRRCSPRRWRTATCGSGIGAVALAALVLVVFQYLVWARVQAYERGEELAQARRASSRRSRSGSSAP